MARLARLFPVHCLWIMATGLLVALTVALPAFADTWAPPRPCVFASESGTYGFKVLEPKFLGTSTGLLFELDADGKERTVWSGKLVNVPHRVHVAEDGKRVVTIDTYGNLGHDHSRVVYDDKGIVLADYKLEEFLTPVEIQLQHVREYLAGRFSSPNPSTVSSRHWARHAIFAFTPEG